MRLGQSLFVSALGLTLFASLGGDGSGGVKSLRTPQPPLPRGNVADLPAFDATQSAGLFVGVRKFQDDPELKEVPFAVDDAVDLAYRFALGVSPPLIPADRVVLALAGEPQKTESTVRLEALLAAGARKADAYPSDIKAWLKEQSRAAGEAGLLVVAFATHGLKQRQYEYLLTTSSRGNYIPDTSVGVHTVVGEVGKSSAWRRLVLLDACRENRKPGARSPAKGKRLELDEALAAEGQVVLAARPHAVLYDDPLRGQGVFTAAVLDGMSCQGPLAQDGSVTLEELANHVDATVAKWERKRPAVPGERSRGGISRTIEGSMGRFPLVSCP